MKKYFIALAVVVMIMSCFFGKTLVMAGEEQTEPVYSRYYTTIEIREGDSLWTIADTYNHNSGMDIRQYIREIKSINRLSSDRIMAGASLSIVYFAKEPMEKEIP